MFVHPEAPIHIPMPHIKHAFKNRLFDIRFFLYLLKYNGNWNITNRSSYLHIYDKRSLHTCGYGVCFVLLGWMGSGEWSECVCRDVLCDVKICTFVYAICWYWMNIISFLVNAQVFHLLFPRYTPVAIVVIIITRISYTIFVSKIFIWNYNLLLGVLYA